MKGSSRISLAIDTCGRIREAVVIGGDTTWKWIIDRGGTTNYAHGYPCFCVTLALEHEGEIVIGGRSTQRVMSCLRRKRETGPA